MMSYKKNRLLPLLSIVVLVLTSCGSIPKNAFMLTPELLQKRVQKTRKYEGISEVDILSASAGVLQDLGFNLDESESKLGLIVGSKERDATEIGQEVRWWITALLTYGYSTLSDETDDYQKFRASVVIRPISKDNDKTHYVSVTFQRIVWDTADKISKQETLGAPKIYQEFFDRLSKSIFLEGQKI